jgi:hypothetical protein
VANGHGGYRQPTNPSPVSGPGALSQRTDGPLHAPVPGGDVQGQAPMGPDPSGLTPFGAPSERPNEDIFAGMPMGPGPGGPAPAPSGLTEQEQQRLRAYLPVLIFQASQPEASPQIKQYVRQLRGELG